MELNGQDYDEAGNEGTQGDLITALEYDSSGDFLGWGDRNGRVTVLKLDSDTTSQKWLHYSVFQSHEPEFDFLKSLEIESKINQLKFCHPIGDNIYLLSTNDKTIKLWKIGPRKKFVSDAVSTFSETGKLRLPHVDTSMADTDLLHAEAKRVFSNAHAYHINSLALNSDTETFVSADDLRINCWRLNHSDTCFNLVDIKPENMEELTEVITAVQCHPQHCNIMAYSSSRGAIKLCDTRMSAICTNYAKVYSDQTASSASKSFITDILNSISDINYSADGRYIVSRDYLTVKIWDINMESRPVKSIPLHDYLRPMLYDLYTSDIIFDKFEVCCSPDGKCVATGSYSNQLKVYHHDGRGTLRNVDLPRTISGDMSPSIVTDSSSQDLSKPMDKMKIADGRQGRQKQTEIRLDEKVLHCTWHPTNNTVAVAGKTGLCLYKV
eukprot:gene1990-2173_t